MRHTQADRRYQVTAVQLLSSYEKATKRQPDSTASLQENWILIIQTIAVCG